MTTTQRTPAAWRDECSALSDAELRARVAEGQAALPRLTRQARSGDVVAAVAMQMAEIAAAVLADREDLVRMLFHLRTSADGI
jgi:hypothetical protein